jgi:hypothetical protein
MADTCAHETCYCDAGSDEYCGTHCRDAAAGSGGGPTCECGHIDCEEATMRHGGVVTTGS